MADREAVFGLVLVAVLAWLLPVTARYLVAGRPPVRPAMSAMPAEANPGTLRYTWVPADFPTGFAAADGWVVGPDGQPDRPIPGWQGLLLGRPLDLNTATREDLEALPGIGPHTATAVIEDRAAHGPFGDVAEFRRVRGIGPKTLARLRPLVTVGPR